MFRSQKSTQTALAEAAAIETAQAAAVHESTSRRAFLESARGVTEQTSRVGSLPIWCLTRVVGDRYSVLTGTSTIEGVDITPATYSWADSVCVHMVAGRGPRIAGDLMAVPAYASSPMAIAGELRSYVGTPVLSPKGDFLGTLCGTGFEVLDEASVEELRRWQDVMESQATLLGAQLYQQIEAMRLGREQDFEVSLRSRDASTLLPDRLGWGLLLRREEERAVDLAESMGVIVGRMHNVRSVRAMRHAAAVVNDVLGERALVARIDARQFGILCGNRLAGEVETMARELQQACHSAGLDIRVGWAMRSDQDGAAGAWKVAEHEALLASRPAGVAV